MARDTNDLLHGAIATEWGVSDNNRTV